MVVIGSIDIAVCSKKKRPEIQAPLLSIPEAWCPAQAMQGEGAGGGFAAAGLSFKGLQGMVASLYRARDTTYTRM
ncbi:hypothetical protein LBMAG45_10000 [Nitrospirota bacterium]|nr:hypothetical protein LBMAG45_10000 [Nitrospirota bacterium]